MPWRRKWQPTPVFWPGEFHGLYNPWGHKESDKTEQLSPHIHLNIKYIYHMDLFIYLHTYITSSLELPSYLVHHRALSRVLDYSVRFSLVIYFIHSSVYMSGASLGAQLQCRRPGFDPWVEKMPWRRAQQPTPVLSPGESHGQRSCRPQGRTVRHN